jgi:lactam utilization protein B
MQKCKQLELSGLSFNRLFQVGALTAFLDQAGMPLNHIKPHGMWVSASEHGLRLHLIPSIS